MPKLIVTINHECDRCKAKIQKVLACLQDEFSIEKIEFEKSSKVTITGKFDADKLSDRLHCKAGKFIKNIEKVKDKKDEKKECKLVQVYPWSYPQCPYPYQAPYGEYPSWQGSCSSCYPQQCQCYYCCKPSSPCACAKCSRSSSCSSDHLGGRGYCCGSSCSSKAVTPWAPAALPYTFPAPFMVCEDSNPSCSVM